MLNRFPRPTPVNSLYPQAHPVFQGKQKERQAEPLSARTPTLFASHIQLYSARICELLLESFLSLLLSHGRQYSFRGIGGCAPKESAAFGCDWDFCGTQSPCLLYRETHLLGLSQAPACGQREPPLFPSGCSFTAASFWCRKLWIFPVFLPKSSYLASSEHLQIIEDALLVCRLFLLCQYRLDCLRLRRLR